MLRKWLAAPLMAALLFSLTPGRWVQAATPGQRFPDVPENHPDRAQIIYLVERKLINGYPDGRFGPADPLNRDAAVKIATQVAGLAPRASGERLGFKDLADTHWSAPYVRSAVAGGLVKGFDDSTFRPGVALTRAQLAVLALRAARQSLDQVPAVTLRDAATTDWFYPAAAVAVAAGLMEAPDGNFRPNDTATRAEAARAFAQAMVYTPKAFDVPMSVTVVPERGQVEVAQPGSEAFTVISAPAPLTVGGRVRTAAASGASISFPDGSSLYLQSLTELQLLRSRGTDMVDGMAVEDLEVELIRGNLFGALVPRLSPEELQAYSPYLARYNNGQADDAVIAPRVRAAAAATGSNWPAGATRLLLFANPGSMEPGDKDGIEVTLVMANEAGEPVSASQGPVSLELLTDVGRVANANPVIPEGFQGISFTLYPPDQEPEDAKTRVTAVAGEVTAALTVPTAKVNWWNAIFAKKTRAKVRMPYSVASIRGSFVAATVSATGNTVSVLGGEATVRSMSGEAEELRDNQYSEVTAPGAAPATPGPIPPDEQRNWLTAKDWVDKASGSIAAAAPKAVERAVKDEQDRIKHLVTMLPADRVQPSVSISSPAGGARLGSRKVTVTGSASDDLKLASVTVAGKPAKVDESGSWEADVTLNPGANTITATARDAAGNTASATVTVEFDAAFPAVTLKAPKAGKGGQVTISGKATAPAGLKSLTVNGAAITPDAEGSFAVAVVLKDGSNLILAEVTDTQGRTATAEAEVKGAGQPPVITLDGPAEPKVTSELFTVSGTVTSQVALKSLKVDGKRALAGDGGAFAAAVKLKPGPNEIEVEAEDEAGNSASATLTVTFDGAAAAVRIAQPKDGLVTRNDQVTVEGSGRAAAGIRSITVNGAPAAVSADGEFSAEVALQPGPNVITVELTDESGRTAVASRTVTRAAEGPVLTIDQPTSGRSATREVTISGSAAAKAGPLRSVTVGGKPMVLGPGGAFSTTVRLKDGENEIEVEARDMAGNSTVETLNLFFDGGAATLSLSSPENGLVTRKAELTVSGSVEKGGKVTEVLVNGTPTSVDARGRFSATVTLQPGENRITVSLPESAGGGSEVRTVVLANSPPAVTISSPAGGAVSTVSEVTVSGSVQTADGKGARVKVDGKVAAVDESGNFSKVVKLEPGENTIEVEAEDEAGNEASASVTVTYEPARPGKDEVKPAKVEEPGDEKPKDQEPKDEKPKDQEPKDDEPKVEPKIDPKTEPKTEDKETGKDEEKETGKDDEKDKK